METERCFDKSLTHDRSIGGDDDFFETKAFLVFKKQPLFSQRHSIGLLPSHIFSNFRIMDFSFDFCLVFVAEAPSKSAVRLGRRGCLPTWLPCLRVLAHRSLAQALVHTFTRSHARKFTSSHVCTCSHVHAMTCLWCMEYCCRSARFTS